VLFMLERILRVWATMTLPTRDLENAAKSVDQPTEALVTSEVEVLVVSP
jgi:hypothetical protein